MPRTKRKFRPRTILSAGPRANLAVGAKPHSSSLAPRQRGLQNVFCANLPDHDDRRCMFRCDFPSLETQVNEQIRDGRLVFPHNQKALNLWEKEVPATSRRPMRTGQGISRTMRNKRPPK